MNKSDKKHLSDIRFRLGGVSDELERISQEIQDIKDNEEEKVDNLPEGLQFSEMAEDMREKIDILDDILNDLEDIDISSICDRFDEI